jgi:N-carbamoyl-L-amino-acid hydrolase
MDPISFDAGLVDLLDKAAGALALPSMRLISGAFHDAKSMHAVSPSAMVFIPCAGGVSHNPNESATAADIAAGARVLALTLATLANLANDRFKE